MRVVRRQCGRQADWGGSDMAWAGLQCIGWDVGQQGESSGMKVNPFPVPFKSLVPGQKSRVFSRDI